MLPHLAVPGGWQRAAVFSQLDYQAPDQNAGHMASWNHEGIIELFRSDPRLAAKLLQGPLGVALPAFSDARIESGTMADLKPAQAHADLVVVLRDGSLPVLGVVVEVQRKEDPDKLFSWPAYIAWLRRALRTEACVLVITQDERVATWASRRIVLGPGGALQPLVLRPNCVPVVDTAADARKAPELAVLSAMVHGGGPVKTAVEVALAASTAAHGLDRDRFLLYFGLIRAALGEAARKVFEMHPHGARFFDESQQQSYERGRAAEKAADVLDVLDARGISASSEQRDQILGCTDIEALKQWLRRAATVASANELFS